jgi:hypothetical protein
MTKLSNYRTNIIHSATFIMLAFQAINQHYNRETGYCIVIFTANPKTAELTLLSVYFVMLCQLLRLYEVGREGYCNDEFTGMWKESVIFKIF